MCADCKGNREHLRVLHSRLTEQPWRPGLFCPDMGVIALVLLAAAAALLVATEWPRVGSRVGLDARRRRRHGSAARSKLQGRADRTGPRTRTVRPLRRPERDLARTCRPDRRERTRSARLKRVTVTVVASRDVLRQDRRHVFHVLRLLVVAHGQHDLVAARSRRDPHAQACVPRRPHAQRCPSTVVMIDTGSTPDAPDRSPRQPPRPSSKRGWSFGGVTSLIQKRNGRQAGFQRRPSRVSNTMLYVPSEGKISAGDLPGSRRIARGRDSDLGAAPGSRRGGARRRRAGHAGRRAPTALRRRSSPGCRG